MGIWSEYRHSYTPLVTVHFENITDDALCFINKKLKYNTGEFTRYSQAITVDELGKAFCDVAHIWGYVDREMEQQLEGILPGLSNTAEMVFSCDADDAPVYMIRFDKRENKVMFLLPTVPVNRFDEIDYGSIRWIPYSESDVLARKLEFLLNLKAKSPGLSDDDTALVMCMNGFTQ